ncbi:hypothetical protein K1719_016648 [Acacia pycnantha]|nr:hypothetical protein K1719_016648 [Acacia pycnantha]
MFEMPLFTVLLLLISAQIATSPSPVHHLPGFEGPLPFHLETGYVGVGESEEVQLFYYFIPSERNPKEDPLMLWISGGPCCSSLSGLLLEIGPIAFAVEEYKAGRVPKLKLRPWSWTKVCSIIFADLPVETGFSYSKTPNPPRSDYELVHHAHQFLRKWLLEHPEYSSNQVYLGADSYSGITVPPIVQEISNGNKRGLDPRINIQGYLLGNPLTTRNETFYRMDLAHRMALVSDEVYMSWQKNCIDSPNESCSRDMDYYRKLNSEINISNILDPKYCDLWDSPKASEVSWMRRSLVENFHEHLPPLSCRSYPYFLINYWANYDRVPEAVHIRKGGVGRWQRCNKENYVEDIPSSFEYHANLSKKGYRSLIYSGDHDLAIPYFATQEWIRALNYSIIDEWRPWLVKGQVAGYTRTYANQMTFATVKGAGHLTPEYKQEESFVMFSRWISKKPL